jgi:hypothetical protein
MIKNYKYSCAKKTNKSAYGYPNYKYRKRIFGNQ